MGLPETVRVKLSSEAAESLSLTPVVVQDIALRELIGHMLGVAGKDERRIRELLLRGTLVVGASRFRWPGWEADVEGLRALLRTFPDPDPSQPFAGARCIRVVVRGGRQPVEIPREAGQRKGLLQRSTFWDLLMEVAAAPDLRYAGYSYRDRADRYTRELTADETARLRAAADMLRYTTLRDQLKTIGAAALELFAER
jgi:hypothetical protein